jgi:FMN phosphatase YigB (HAD superfamily)
VWNRGRPERALLSGTSILDKKERVDRMNSRFKKIIVGLGGEGWEPIEFIFDYDSTIARVPIDWPLERSKFRDYFNEMVPELHLPVGMRVDEMEAAVIQQTDLDHQIVFGYREILESSLDGQHEPIPLVVELVQSLGIQPNVRLFIVSNNLEGTVRSGLRQLQLLEFFTCIYGVDTVGLPKPFTKAADMLNSEHQVNIENSVFFGDSPATDGLFCQELGIPFINIKEI